FSKVQSLLDDAQKLTGDAQKAKWGELYDIIAANIPVYPLFHRKSATAYDKASLPGFKAISLTGLSFLDVSSTK
ncbi:MAG TPA: ABC transporter substrate-binding protein, partial [Propionibacteriaceae bacterium]|nr:ABC transporter substrate-binding protein [Propionibacteriaceae bacterium]